MRKILAAITITYALIFSMRVVIIPTPLAIPEQISIIAMLIEYTMYKSKEKKDDN